MLNLKSARETSLMYKLNKLRNKLPLASDVSFITGYIILFLMLMAILRGLMLYRNFDLTTGVPFADIFRAFLVGIRFDLVIATTTAVPLVFVLLFAKGLNTRKVAILWLSIIGSLTAFAGIVDLDFYHQFHVRLNSLAFQYLNEDPATVSSMIWNGFPVIYYLLLWAFICALYISGLRCLNAITEPEVRNTTPIFIRLIVFILVFFLFALGARGTLRSGPPLRWGDAFLSQHLFSNHLGLNSSYTFIKAVIAANGGNIDKQWLTTMPGPMALAISRKLLLDDQDELIDPNTFPVLRIHTPEKKLERTPKNVVFIIMESFSAEFVGALGHAGDITPEFDKLTKEGLLFDNFFSNGTHTHQGMFATGACFPNLPGHEYLMQQAEGQHAFSGLPAVLKPREFSDAYVYNGEFSWDNQKGFFRNQGMTHFIGRDDYENPKFSDPTWGVSDEDMFNRSVKELSSLPKEQPFYAILQTLSNHMPYALPDKLPIEPVLGFGELDEHLTAQRYSDWALGQFFKQAKKTNWYEQTVFVIVGDHGFGINRQLSEIDLLRFHVPMLIIAPGIQQAYGRRHHTVGTQVDIVPTLVSLLGEPFKHQCWGRDLLSLNDDDSGFGFIKPSGSDQTVAFIKGDNILIKRPHESAILGQYSFYPKETYQISNDKKLQKSMQDSLNAYVQTSMKALLENKTGLGKKD